MRCIAACAKGASLLWGRPAAMSSLLVKPNLQRPFGEFVAVTPESAGWQDISLSVVRLEREGTYDFRLHDEESVIVVLGGKINVVAAGQKWAGLGERKDV